jgi:HD-like signal output (HDOD) protein
MKKLLFVDDEANVLQGLQRQLRAMRNEWNMNFMAGGQLALAFLEKNPVDVVITDMMMPGMDGAQLLSEVARRHPQTVRIALSGQAEHEAIMRLVGPAHQYLSKPCAADDLRKAIVRAFELRDLLGNDQLKKLTARLKSLPILSAAQSQLTEELSQETPSLERIGEIVSRDIGMTAKIMQLVNSAFFGLARQLTSPTEAVAYLGTTTVRALALSAEMFSQFDPRACRMFSLEILERHSWHTGLLARRVAQLESQNNQILDQCFLAGMMHDVGQLVLATGLPTEYSKVIQQARQQNLPVCQVEQAVFGASHADVGAYLLGLWGLPNLIIEAVAWHHTPSRSLATQFSLVMAVHVADVLIHERQHDITEEPPPVLDLTYIEKIGLANRIETWRAASLDHESL